MSGAQLWTPTGGNYYGHAGTLTITTSQNAVGRFEGEFVVSATGGTGSVVQVRFTDVDTGKDLGTIAINAVTPMSSTALTADEKRRILAAHNAVRAAEGASLPDMQWDDTLAANSQNYASKCLFGHSSWTNNVYTYPGGYGENLWMGTSGTVESGVGGWYDEKPYYSWEYPCCGGNFSDYGHYTQLVWESTTKVGCGYFFCSGTILIYDNTGAQTGSTSNQGILVCQYSLPGNSPGQYPYQRP